MVQTGVYVTSLPNGEYATINYMPNDGYKLEKLYVDGIDITNMLSENSYHYGQIRKDITVLAVFEKEKAKLYNLEIQDADYGISFLRVPEGQTVKYTINNEDGWKLNSLAFNGQDVTSDIENNIYITPKITGNSLLSASFEKEESAGIKNQKMGNIRVYTNNDGIVVENAKNGQSISVYDLDGIAITQVKANQTKICIPLSSGKIYIISIGNQKFKIRK